VSPVHPLSRSASVRARHLPTRAWWFAALIILSGCASRPLADPSGKQMAAPVSSEGEPRLQLDLSSDFQMRKIQGLDFDVLYYTSAKRKCSMTIYVGFHPPLRGDQQGTTPVQHESGHVGNIPVEWERWTDKSIFHSETLVRGLYKQFSPDEPGGPSALLVHIFISAESPEEAGRLETAVSKMKLATPKS
jgi:hypothetical protein